jgi:hypothetical protein
MSTAAKLHPIETVNMPGRRGGTLNLLVGCKGHPCKAWCWAHPLAKRLKCPLCRTFEPHTHWERAENDPSGFDNSSILPKKSPHCYFQDMAEPNDFDESEILRLKENYENNPQHLFQLLTHFPMEFYAKYPKWPRNVWCCGTFTSGEIAFPEELECGVRVAYCEPVLGELKLAVEKPDYVSNPKDLAYYEVRNCDLLVIGLLNHANYEKLGITLEQLAGWIKSLIADADALGIKVFMKSHKLWAKLGIPERKEWPKM